MARILIAPDKFKGTLSAEEVADEVASAVRRIMPDAKLAVAPMADGGEGTSEIIAGRRSLNPAETDGHNALMEPVRVRYFEKNGVCAVDCAAVVGQAMLGGRALTPWQATSYPLGQFIRRMLDQGMREIIIGLGGSATVDGGAGLLQALGARFFDMAGREIPVPVTAATLGAVASADLSKVDVDRLKQAITILADVDLPLLPDAPGEMSSLSFAPQKGVKPHEIETLHNALASYSSALLAAITATHNRHDNPTDDAGSHFEGAAGGLGFALHRILGCDAYAGAEYLLNAMKPFDRLPDLVVTGEGAFDSQSLTGKVTGTIIDECTSRNIPVIVVAGRSEIPESTSTDTPPSIITTSPFLPSPNAPLNHSNALTSLRHALSVRLSALLTALIKNQK